jgi:hypothetical protein
MNINWQLVSISLLAISAYDIYYRCLNPAPKPSIITPIHTDSAEITHPTSISSYHLFGIINLERPSQQNTLPQGNTPLKIVSIINGYKPSVIAEINGNHVFINSNKNSETPYRLRTIQKDIAFVQFNNRVHASQLLRAPASGINITLEKNINRNALIIERDHHSTKVQNLLISISKSKAKPTELSNIESDNLIRDNRFSLTNSANKP